MIKNLKEFHTLIFDFDGVFTNNKVYLNENGIEQIRCDRGDGLGLKILNSYIKKYHLNLEIYILSKEKNKVVNVRAKKLGIKCFQGIDEKLKFMKNNFFERFGDVENINQGLIYVGNDINDLESMLYAGYSICPKDSHDLIKKYANVILERNGGDGFVRECIEHIINFNKMELSKVIELINID
tara:strand:+ start:80 stop:628 length:549 start_codon:yes stop_codon:yes gene_type:complete